MTGSSTSQAGQATSGMPTPVRVRPARPADAPALAELLAELGYPQPTGELGPRIATLADTDTDTVLVAEIGEQVVGMASLHVTPFFNEAAAAAASPRWSWTQTAAGGASGTTCLRRSRPPPGGVGAARSS